MDDGILRDMRVFHTEESGKKAGQACFEEIGMDDKMKQKETQEWGTIHAIWRYDLQP